MKNVFAMAALVLGMALLSSAVVRAADEKANDVVVGYIHKVDFSAGSFVVGGANESQTTFRFGVRVGEREATCTLDGKQVSASTALKAGRKASVSSISVDKQLWATKVEVTSAK